MALSRREAVAFRVFTANDDHTGRDLDRDRGYEAAGAYYFGARCMSAAPTLKKVSVTLTGRDSA